MPDNKTTGNTVARVAAVGAILLAVVVLALLLLRGDNASTYRVLFQNAGQLVKGDDVQIGGRRTGSIEEIELTGDNQAQVTIKMEAEFAPLHQGTRAVIRATSLSGIANRYIALTPGPNNARPLDEGAQISAERSTAPVDLDQLFNTLDPKARRSLQELVQGSAEQYRGKGRQANQSARYFNPAISTTRQLVNEVLTDQQAFTDFIVNSSQLVTAVAERRDDLAALVGNANATAAAIGQENVALAQALDALPTTLRRANTTFVNLRFTLDDLDVLVAESKPATRRLAPFLRELRPLVAAARPTIRDLRRLVFQAGPNNDLTDAVRKLPGLQRVATPTFQNSIAALRRSQPVIEFIRPYVPELAQWFRDFGQGASNYDANGHFARIQPIFNAFSLNSAGVLDPVPPESRSLGLVTGQFSRCPGAASQPPPDGSAPFLDGGNLGRDDCNPDQVLPGP